MFGRTRSWGVINQIFLQDFMESSVGKQSFPRPKWRWKLILNHTTKKSQISLSDNEKEFFPWGGCISEFDNFCHVTDNFRILMYLCYSISL